VPLTNIAPRIEVQQIADDLPSPTGGMPKDGVYVQTWVVQYNGQGGDRGGIHTTLSRETMEISGTVGRFVFSDNDHDDQTGGFRLTATPTEVTIGYECPAAPPKTFGFDVSGDDLAIYDPPLARFFTRQSGGHP
jgi:hypothetical protein